MLLWHKTIEIQIFSFAGFASICQVPTVLTSPGRRVANAFGSFAINTTEQTLRDSDLSAGLVTQVNEQSVPRPWGCGTASKNMCRG